MNIDGIPTRSLRAHSEQRVIAIIDQTRLPHALHWVRVATLEEAAHAIRAMQVRGAPLIGATAAYGLAIALGQGSDDDSLSVAIDALWATRPTAVNLHWALSRMRACLTPLAPERIALVRARFMARRKATRFSSCSATDWATSMASSSGRLTSRMLTLTDLSVSV